MGYYYKITFSDLIIKNEEKIQIMNFLNNEVKKTKKIKKIFKIRSIQDLGENLSEGFLIEDVLKVSKDKLEDILSNFYYDFTVLPNGDLTSFAFDNKLKKEYFFFKLIAPFIKTPSLIALDGEDGKHAWAFDGEKLHSVESKKEAKNIVDKARELLKITKEKSDLETFIKPKDKKIDKLSVLKI